MVGFAIAFIFNGPMMWIERFLFEKARLVKKSTTVNMHRANQLFVDAYRIHRVLFTMILTYIIPQLYDTDADHSYRTSKAGTLEYVDCMA
jgi:hypothetical protein